MSDKSFEKIWDIIIEPSITRCLDDIDEKDSKLIQLECSNKDEFKKSIEKIYKRKREWLKCEYLPEEGSNAVLDFHKLSAILGRSIIGNKFFKFNEYRAKELHKIINDSSKTRSEKLKNDIDTIYINYKLAFLVSSGICYVDLLSKATKRYSRETDLEKKKWLNTFIKKLDSNRRLYKYPDSDKHDDFESSVIVAMMKNDQLMRDFDYLAFSAMMFQWQEYTKMRVYFEMIDENKPQGELNLNDLIQLF